MNDKLKQYLEAYLGDLEYWCGFRGDLESVNHYTSGTQEFSSIEELKEYTARLDFLIHKTTRLYKVEWTEGYDEDIPSKDNVSYDTICSWFEDDYFSELIRVRDLSLNESYDLCHGSVIPQTLRITTTVPDASGRGEVKLDDDGLTDRMGTNICDVPEDEWLESEG